MSLSLSEAVADPDLLLPVFGGDLSTFATWTVILAALEGRPLTDEQLITFTQLTGRAEAPTEPASEAWVVAGRRSAKTRHLALLAVWQAACKDYRGSLAPGERAVAAIIACDKRQAKVAFNYVRAILKGVPALAEMVVRETAEAIELSNGASIEIHVASFRSVRGRSYCFVGIDEAAFLRDEESASPDVEVYVAALPGLATIKGSLFIGSSSPWGKRGLVYDKYAKYWGQPAGPLIFQGPSKLFNPTLPDSLIAEAVARDPAAAQSEWFGKFRSDLSGLVDRAVVEACVEKGVTARPPTPGTHYRAFVDMSGGVRDFATAAIAHREDGKAILDLLLEFKAPFSPAAVIAEMSATLKMYGIRTISGDRYAAEFPREHFQRNGITYRPSEQNRSALYLNLLPSLHSRTVVLLDSTRLITQICTLERRAGAGGRDTVDHRPGSHDDAANACAGAVSLLSTKYEIPVAQIGSYL